MKAYPPALIRNVALVGHGGAGKTTLAEALLHQAGVIGRPGRVEDGNTVTDFEPEEQKRGQSASVGLAPFEWEGFKVNLLDCPGYADFEAEALAALRVADLAVFVVSAVEGVQVETEVLWKEAADLGLPRLFFVNKLDRERSSFETTLEQLQATFGAGVAPLELPIGAEAGFSGVADLLSDTAITYNGGPPVSGPIPDDMAITEHTIHDALVEGIVVADDGLMERYLEGDVPTVKQLEQTLAHGVADAKVFPVLCGSATKEVGVDRLATFVCELGPSPLQHPPVMVEAGDTLAEIEPDPEGQPLACVWKTIADRHVGKISLFKVLSGSLKGDEVLVDTRAHAEEKLHALFTLRGREQVPVDGFNVGDIGAVAKLADVTTGDTLAPKGTPVTIPWPDRPAPAVRIGIHPRSKGDDDKLMTAVHRLQEEDPALSVWRDDETHQTVLGGAGETHLAVVTERLARKFGVEIDTEPVLVAYRETVTGTAEAEGRYKKQTGGHGQFGVASVRIEPTGRGEGFRFVDQIVGGAIPRQFIPAVQKGIEEAMAAGGLHGWPVVDVAVTLLDGKYHPVDSSEMSFKMAGALAFREAMKNASPVLLEPISELTVVVPPAYQGDVIGDLNSRRGRVQGTETGPDGECIVTAAVPASEILRYTIDLRSMTGGRGRATSAHSHYDSLPPRFWEGVDRSDRS